MTEDELDAPAEEAAPRTPREIRAVVQDLLKHGLLEAEKKPNLYRTACGRQQELKRILEPLDLDLKLDETRGLLFVVLRQPEGDAASADGQPLDGDEQDRAHPLIRRQRLTLEQSLLVAVLRKRFMAHEEASGIGETGARVAVDELLGEMLSYLPDSGSDIRDEKRLRALLEQLRMHGLVSEVDQHDRVTIRPLICHVADPGSLQGLLGRFRELAGGGKGT